MKWHIGLVASSVAMTFTLVFPAHAQDSSPAAEPAGGSDIVVTAQKREERLVDVPISITAASMERIASAGLSDLRDLAQITPGLLNTNNGLGFQPAIRGITNTGTSAGEESNTALYIDDVYLPAQFAGLFELKNIKRVEVLKGPQGTLYGRNSTAGAIRSSRKTRTFPRRCGRASAMVSSRTCARQASTPRPPSATASRSILQASMSKTTGL